MHEITVIQFVKKVGGQGFVHFCTKMKMPVEIWPPWYPGCKVRWPLELLFVHPVHK